MVKYAFILSLLPAAYCTVPKIILDDGTFIGMSSGGTEGFFGIPFARPPLGDLRLRPPVPNAPYNGTFNATSFGPACIQQPTVPPTDEPNINPTTLEILQNATSGPPLVDDEDCLSINVIKPSSTSSGPSLPVVYWIYGGAFEIGASSTSNGTVIVERSIEIGMPVIYVSVNYRLNALGFPQGKETREAKNGNLGFLDQRQGLRWVQRYISEFGGDPAKVTIWGESAGAISVTTQMLINEGNDEGLFRAAFAESGSPLPTGTVEDGQSTMNEFAAAAGCSEFLGSPAVFDCLRSVSIEDIRAGINATPNQFDFRSIVLAWNPAADGTVLPIPYQQMVLHSSISRVPLISGDCDDEGTLFSLSNSNITTPAELEDYLTEFWASSNRTGVQALLEVYPDDPVLGSPFDTGHTNAVTPEFKRLAAMTGDFIFQAPRRLFFRQIAEKQPVFAFLSKRLKDTSVLGAFHSSDLQNVYGPGDMTDYLVRFATTLDPNGGNTNRTEIEWPRYTLQSPKMLTFLDGNVSLALTDDTYRERAMGVMIDFSLANPLP